MAERVCHVPDEPRMTALGMRLGQCLMPGTILYLYGDLGAGKTTLVRGILGGLGHHGAVKSPTYTLVEPYDVNGLAVYHFDLYRLADPEELEYLGVRDYFHSQAVVLVEWPEKGGALLPPADLAIYIDYRTEGRDLRFVGASGRGNGLIDQVFL